MTTKTAAPNPYATHKAITSPRDGSVSGCSCGHVGRCPVLDDMWNAIHYDAMGYEGPLMASGSFSPSAAYLYAN